jgi:cyanophycinase
MAGMPIVPPHLRAGSAFNIYECNGLGLVPFAIEVHTSQMGTLTRLIHAVDLGLVPEGWAIDENTVLQVDDQQFSIYGQGHVYRVWRENNAWVQVTILEDSYRHVTRA